MNSNSNVNELTWYVIRTVGDISAPLGIFSSSYFSIMAREKRRVRPSVSTCLFADRIGSISADTYQRIVPGIWRKQGQTCVSTFVCVKKPPVPVVGSRASSEDRHSSRVVAMGVGTKFCSTRQLRETTDSRQVLVRDCHAEIIACRALRRALLEEMMDDVSSHNPASGSDAPFRMLMRTGKRQWRVCDDVTFHMYCSTTPCGNSTIRRWARGGSGDVRTDLDEWAWPQGPHPAFSAHAKAHGQCALLVKRDVSLLTAEQEKNLVNKGATHYQRSKLFGDAIPPGRLCLHKVAVNSLVLALSQNLDILDATNLSNIHCLLNYCCLACMRVGWEVFYGTSTTRTRAQQRHINHPT